VTGEAPVKKVARSSRKACPRSQRPGRPDVFGAGDRPYGDAGRGAGRVTTRGRAISCRGQASAAFLEHRPRAARRPSERQDQARRPPCAPCGSRTAYNAFYGVAREGAQGGNGERFREACGRTSRDVRSAYSGEVAPRVSSGCSGTILVLVVESEPPARLVASFGARSSHCHMPQRTSVPRAYAE
jgi:hypothetical protein